MGQVRVSSPLHMRTPHTSCKRATAPRHATTVRTMSALPAGAALTPSLRSQKHRAAGNADGRVATIQVAAAPCAHERTHAAATPVLTGVIPTSLTHLQTMQLQPSHFVRSQSPVSGSSLLPHILQPMHALVRASGFWHAASPPRAWRHWHDPAGPCNEWRLQLSRGGGGAPVPSRAR